MKKLLLLFLVALAVVGVGLMQTQSAGAEEILNEACSGAAGSSTVCKTQVSDNPVSGPGSIINRVTRVVAVAAGAIAVIIIIVSGIRFTTSHGDPQSVNAAKNTLLYAIIGLIVIIAAQAIISYVVTRLYS